MFSYVFFRATDLCFVPSVFSKTTVNMSATFILISLEGRKEKRRKIVDDLDCHHPLLVWHCYSWEFNRQQRLNVEQIQINLTLIIIIIETFQGSCASRFVFLFSFFVLSINRPSIWRSSKKSAKKTNDIELNHVNEDPQLKRYRQVWDSLTI